MTNPAPFDFDEIAGDLSEDLRGRFKSELDPGERLLWSGRPVAVKEHPLWRASLVLLGLLCLFGVLFAVVFSAGLIILTVYSGIILAVLLWARHMDRRKLAGMRYALTDRRAIIWQPLFWRQGAIRVQSLARGEVASISRLEFDDGTGDISFRIKGLELAQGARPEPSSLRGIADVRRVEEQMRRVLMGTPDHLERDDPGGWGLS